MTGLNVCMSVCLGLLYSAWKKGVREAPAGVSDGGAASPEATFCHIVHTAAA